MGHLLYNFVNALIEAMAMGLPIVATDVGAMPEIIDGNGYLVSVLHPENAAKALCQLLSNIALRSLLLALGVDALEFIDPLRMSLLEFVLLMDVSAIGRLKQRRIPVTMMCSRAQAGFLCAHQFTSCHW